MSRWLLALFLPLLASCSDPKDTGTETPDDSGTDTVDDTGLDTSDPVIERLTILHTNDNHSHFNGYGPETEYSPDSVGNDSTIGGLARISALAAEIRAASENPVLFLDAGDFSEGTLFQLLGTSHASELQVLQAMGYDAITIGNHEFSWGPAWLASMITMGDSLGVTLPILAGNLVTDPVDPADDTFDALLTGGRVVPSMVFELDNGLRVGIYGAMGQEAASVAPGKAPMTVADLEESSSEMVAELQAQGVDLVVALTHAGVTGDPSTSPDELLAAAVPGIDIVVGGHSHTATSTPLLAGDDSTPVVQAGAYAAFLGQVDLMRTDSGPWQVERYTLHPIDDSIQGDPAITTLIGTFRDALDSGPLAELGFSYDQPIAEIPADMPASSCVESALGDFVTDAYRERVNASGGVPVDFAFESQGVIRDGLLAGSGRISSFADFFRVLPLGNGADGRPGYPLVTFWVTAAELQDACEVTASVSPSYGCDYFIELSGLRCNLDMERSSFNRTRSVDRWNGESWEPMDLTSPQLYHIAVDSYVASLMGMLEGLTFGAVVITPKDEKGNPYASTAEMILDADPETEGLQELKLWQAIVEYAATFPDTNSDKVPDLPERYAAPEERITGWE